MNNQMGELTVGGFDVDGTPINGFRTYPTYTCGHCSKVVVMRYDRTRPRTMCHKCAQWICETNELCAADCTPLRELADDGMLAADKWKTYIPAIMSGVTSLDEAKRLNLV